MTANRRDDTALSTGPAADPRPAESGNGGIAPARMVALFAFRDELTRLCESKADAGEHEWLRAFYTALLREQEKTHETPALTITVSPDGTNTFSHERIRAISEARIREIIAALDARESGAESRGAQRQPGVGAETDATDDGGKPSPLSRT